MRGRLPDEIDEPIIAKVEADAQPIIYHRFHHRSHGATGAHRLSSIAIVVDRFKNLTGVADVQILGERRYAMRIWIDRDRLAGYGLTVQDVEDAIRSQNAEIPAGRIESSDREFTVLSRTGAVDAGGIRATSCSRRPAAFRSSSATSRASNWAPPTSAASAATTGQKSITDRHRQAGGGQSARCLRARSARLLPSVIEEPAGGHRGDDRLTTATVFIERSIQSVFITILEAIAPRRPDHHVLPALVPGLDHPDRHHPGFAHRRPSR